MQTKTIQLLGGALAALALLGAAPSSALAQNRQKTKNDWRNLSIISGGLAAFGLIKNDPTLSFVGAAGALYSVDRYEKDRKSQDKGARARARLFSKPYIIRDGQRYYRRTMVDKGKKYYQFERSRERN
ncbi:hypothetical protein [Armatimonas sp.]|uniref:hypothetical protein n=1 Tax=Armatimonas sp. TaxID=1872638 RepID=UPI00286AC63E|nr:hypothetical protein [Armatimonas sp.]